MKKNNFFLRKFFTLFSTNYQFNFLFSMETTTRSIPTFIPKYVPSFENCELVSYKTIYPTANSNSNSKSSSSTDPFHTMLKYKVKIHSIFPSELSELEKLLKNCEGIININFAETSILADSAVKYQEKKEQMEKLLKEYNECLDDYIQDLISDLNRKIPEGIEGKFFRRNEDGSEYQPIKNEKYEKDTSHNARDIKNGKFDNIGMFIKSRGISLSGSTYKYSLSVYFYDESPVHQKLIDLKFIVK